MELRVAWRSVAGGRARNEDRVVCGDGIYAVVDGMGGEAAGDVAASIAAEGIAASGDRPLVTVLGDIRDAIDARGRADPRVWGMGAVATVVRVRGTVAEIAHVGDTRAWLRREGTLRLLTRDHTIAQVAREMGVEAVATNRVTRDLGSSRGPPEHWVDALTETLQYGDRLLLTSDGLHGVLGAQELELYLGHGDEEEVVDRMVAAVLARGAPDNVSVLVVGVIG